MYEERLAYYLKELKHYKVGGWICDCGLINVRSDLWCRKCETYRDDTEGRCNERLGHQTPENIEEIELRKLRRAERETKVKHIKFRKSLNSMNITDKHLSFLRDQYRECKDLKRKEYLLNLMSRIIKNEPN